MGGVLDDPKARQDVVIRRGAQNEWAILWEQSTDGQTYETVELYGSGYEAHLRLLSHTGEVWLEKEAFITQDHLTLLRLYPNDFAAPVWQSRSGGVWICDLVAPSAPNATLRHGEGYFYLED